MKFNRLALATLLAVFSWVSIGGGLARADEMIVGGDADRLFAGSI